MNFVRLALSLSTALSLQSALASGTGDIGSGTVETTVLWCSNPAKDIDVKVAGRNVIVEIYDEIEPYRATYELADGEVFNPENFHIFAFHKKWDTHGMVGSGVSLSATKSSGSMIHAGNLYVLSCGKPGTQVGF